jgi:hypothetical protein
MNLTHCFRQTRRKREGMVLIEVVMALTIFALVAFSLVMALDSAFDAEMDRNEIDVAMRGIENEMALIHIAPVTPGETDMPDDGTGVLYHLSVTPQQMTDQKGAQVSNMYRATISAKWTARGQAQERDISELIYQP